MPMRLSATVCILCLIINVACLAWLSHLHGEIAEKVKAQKSQATVGEFIVELHRVENHGRPAKVPTPCDCPECKAERESGTDADAWRLNAEDPADLLPVPVPTLEPNKDEAKSSPHWSPVYRAPVSAAVEKNGNKDLLIGQLWRCFRHSAVA